MGTTTIKINKYELSKLIKENFSRIGSPDWDIYTDLDGNLDCRHDTNPNNGWYFLIDLYSFWDDDDTRNCSVDALGDWLESDGIPYFEKLEINYNEFIEVEYEKI